MLQKLLLTNREFVITSEHANGGRLTWYTPTKYLKEKYPSVIETELTDTTSSAGDWEGYIFQKIGNRVYLIPFSQENRNYSFVLNTGESEASFPFQTWLKDYKNFLKAKNENI